MVVMETIFKVNSQKKLYLSENIPVYRETLQYDSILQDTYTHYISKISQ